MKQHNLAKQILLRKGGEYETKTPFLNLHVVQWRLIVFFFPKRKRELQKVFICRLNDGKCEIKMTCQLTSCQTHPV